MKYLSDIKNKNESKRETELVNPFEKLNIEKLDKLQNNVTPVYYHRKVQKEKNLHNENNI